MDSLLGVSFNSCNHLSLSGSSSAKLEEDKKAKIHIILITTPEEKNIDDAHISDCSVASVCGEPSTETSDSFRVLTTENPSYDNSDDDGHDDDVADLLRCFQNVR